MTVLRCESGCRFCCDDEKEILPLTFEKDSYVVTAGWDFFIDVRSGNKDYSLSLSEPEVMEFVNVLSLNEGFGSLVIRPKQKGETTLLVTDNVSGEQQRLNIKVVDAFLTFMVGRTDHSFFSGKAHFVLTKDAFRTFYLYSEYKEKLSQGTYACTSTADGKRLLTLTQTTLEGEKVYRFVLIGKKNRLLCSDGEISWNCLDSNE